MAPLIQLLPGDIDDPATQCQPDPPPYGFDMPGRVEALLCTDPGLPKGSQLYAYQLDSHADFEATWRSFNKVIGFSGTNAGPDCPPAKGGQGTAPMRAKWFPPRPGQLLECVTVRDNNGPPQPVYTWTLPTEDAFIVAGCSARREVRRNLRPGHDRLMTTAADSTTDGVVTWQVITGSARSGPPGQWPAQPGRVGSHDGPGGVVADDRQRPRSLRHFRSADGAALAVASPAASGFKAKRLSVWFRSWLRCVIVPGCRLVVQVSCETGEAPARRGIV